MKKFLAIVIAFVLAFAFSVTAAEMKHEGKMPEKCAEHMKAMKKDCPMMKDGHSCGMLCGLNADFKVKNTKKGVVIEINAKKDGDSVEEIQKRAGTCSVMFGKGAAAAAKSDDEEVVCPVMGTKMKKSKAHSSYEYKGKTYYFCCAGCPEMFKADPEKYLKK